MIRMSNPANVLILLLKNTRLKAKREFSDYGRRHDSEISPCILSFGTKHRCFGVLCASSVNAIIYDEIY